jgi:hypothetical protein
VALDRLAQDGVVRKRVEPDGRPGLVQHLVRFGGTGECQNEDMPLNTASYALLTQVMAQQCDLSVGQQVELQLSRPPCPYPLLNVRRKPASVFEYEGFEVLEYQCHGPRKAPVAV